MGKLLTIIVLLCALLGCSQPAAVPAGNATPPVSISATGTTPHADSISLPRITRLDTCPAPTAIVAPCSSSLQASGQPLVLSVHISVYGAEQGLYSLINTIKKDHLGNFWLGTGGGGIIRYDGKTATTFTTAQGLAANNIRAIAEDQQGNLWIGTHGGGVSFYNGRCFTTITKSQGLSSNSIRGIILQGPNTWLATYGGGINIYNGQSFTHLTTHNSGLNSNNVNCIIRSHDGSVWCGTDSGITHFTHTNLSQPLQGTTYTPAHGLAALRVVSIAEDKNGVIWVGTATGGLSSIRLTSGAPVINTFTSAHGLPHNTINHVFEDSKGTMWVCTENGVCSFLPHSLFSAGSNAFTIYNSKVGMSTNHVECAAEDNTGHMWFGTDGGGANRFGNESFKVSIESKENPGTAVTSLVGDRANNIWFSGDGGSISRYDRNQRYTYHAADMTESSHLTCMLHDKQGHLWMGTSGNCLYRCNQPPTGLQPLQLAKYTATQGLACKSIWCLTEDTAGHIWIGTDAGLFCYTNGELIHYTAAQGLGNNIVWCSLSDKSGNLWFGTFGGGISRFVPPSPGNPKAHFVTYNTTHGLASNSVKSITEDKSGNIWIGTGGGGVSRYDRHSFVTYTTQYGLANNVVVNTSADMQGNIWLGTNEGFSVLKGFTRDKAVSLNAETPTLNTDLSANYKPVFESYNFKNGFPVKDLNTNSMYIDSGGIIWAGSAHKLVRFHYAAHTQNTTPPLALITGIQVGGKKVCWYTLQQKKKEYRNTQSVDNIDTLSLSDSLAIINEEFYTLGDISTPSARNQMHQELSGVQFDSVTPFYPLPTNLVLPYHNNSIAFDFSIIELGRPYLARYQYKLDGYDADWNAITDRSNASFGNIHEGVYTFRLKAMSPDGVWSAPITYTFRILPPFYRTWQAYAAYVILGICLLYFFIHFRTRILKKENLRLESIVADRTAQIEREKAAAQMQANDLQKLNEFKDKTFSILSHDLRGPIGTSTAVLTMLDEGHISTDEFLDLKKNVLDQLTATGTLLDNLLRWAKGSMEGSILPHPQSIDLRTLAERNGILFKEKLKEKQITFNNEIPDNLHAWCDLEHLDIVLRNLISNAIKFTPRKGSITVNASISDGWISIEVTDTGVGMTEQQINNLFKPIVDNTTYGTAGEKGTGLGLLLSYEFIKANNGQVQVTSKHNAGSTFRLMLPATSV